MQIVVQRFAFAQEFGRKDEVVTIQLLPELDGVTDRNGGFDDHHRLRIDTLHILYYCLNRLCVEVIGLGIVIGWGSDDDVFRANIGFALVERSFEVQFLVCQVVFDLDIFDGRLLAVQHRDFFGDDVNGHHFVVLGKENCVGESDVASSCDSDFHLNIPFSWIRPIAILYAHPPIEHCSNMSITYYSIIQGRENLSNNFIDLFFQAYP